MIELGARSNFVRYDSYVTIFPHNGERPGCSVAREHPGLFRV